MEPNRPGQPDTNTLRREKEGGKGCLFVVYLAVPKRSARSKTAALFVVPIR
jgi:hypothetical protein